MPPRRKARKTVKKGVQNANAVPVEQLEEASNEQQEDVVQLAANAQLAPEPDVSVLMPAAEAGEDVVKLTNVDDIVETPSVKQKGRGKRRAAKKEKASPVVNDEVNQEAVWAVSSRSDDSRKNVVLIRRRKTETEQQNEDPKESDVKTVHELATGAPGALKQEVINESESSVIAGDSLSMTAELNPKCENADAPVGKADAHVAKPNLMTTSAAATELSEETGVAEAEATDVKARPKRRSRNSRSEIASCDPGPCLEARVTRSGRMSTRSSAKQTEPVLINEPPQNSGISDSTKVVDGLDTAKNFNVDSSDVPCVSNIQAAAAEKPCTSSGLMTSDSSATSADVAVHLSPKELSDVPCQSNDRQVDCDVTPPSSSMRTRRRKCSAGPSKRSDPKGAAKNLQSALSPEISAAKNKAKECGGNNEQVPCASELPGGEPMSTDTLACSNVQERDSSSLSDEKCVDSAAAANGSEASTSINSSTADADNADKTVTVRVAADSMQSSSGPHPGSEDVNDSKRDSSLKIPELIVTSEDGLVSEVAEDTNLRASGCAETENVTSLSQMPAEKMIETAGNSRILSSSEIEPHSDEEIPLKKRRIRAMFDSASNLESLVEPNVSTLPVSENGGEVLTERHVNIPDSNLVKSVTDNSANLSCLPSALTRRGSSKFVGGHVSVTGSVASALRVAQRVGSRAVGMFIKRQGSFFAEPLSTADVAEFKQLLKTYDIAPHLVVPHASYLLNCGSGVMSELENSRESLVDDLRRCQSLGLPLFNFHPGSFQGSMSADECIELIASSINYAHSQVKDVITVLENMCGQVNTVGGNFLELRRIINRITDKSRIGICLDTCHAFAAGYNLSTESGRAKMMEDFMQIIGIKYLKAIHVNDSKDDVGSHRDHHAAIGQGKIGVECFKWIMNEPLFDNLPIILETPFAGHKTEIDLLYSFCLPISN